MTLDDVLRERRDAILSRWFDLVAESYPPETSGFLKREGDRFANPVASTISRGLREIYDEFLGGGDETVLRAALDRAIRIRSVQDFAASSATAFVFQLKDIVAEELGDERSSGEFRDFERRVDGLALLAFDVYMGCRDQLHEIRRKEIGRRSSALLERAKSGDIHK
ncbi:RsbRD N-terminal domain-containing protein [Elusimicrobiota bacterium]